MRGTKEEDRLAKRLAVVERDNARLREGPPADVGLVGCADHGCVVCPPDGMGTNGGCRCPDVVLRRMIRWQAREIAKLRAELAEQDRRGCKACHEEGPPGCVDHR